MRVVHRSQVGSVRGIGDVIEEVAEERQRRDTGNQGDHGANETTDQGDDKVDAQDLEKALPAAADHLDQATDREARTKALVNRGLQGRDSCENARDPGEQGGQHGDKGAEGGVTAQHVEHAEDKADGKRPAQGNHADAEATLDAGSNLDVALLGGGVDSPCGQAGPLIRIAGDAKYADDGHEAGKGHEQDGLDPTLVTGEHCPVA